MSKARAGLVGAMQRGWLPRSAIGASIAVVPGPDASALADLPDAELVRRWVASRRGHGFLLAATAADVAVERV
jgi:hypothetical protein